MNREIQRAYSRGYTAGAKWPEHKPPFPPNPIIRLLMEALRELRDVADTQCAMLGEDDDYAKQFDEPIDRADAALVAVGEWLKEGNSQ